jgi:NADH-quinone oxidoreductase subunit K
MFINRNNIISLLMALEIMLLSVNINFVAFSFYLKDLTGQIFAIFTLTIAGAEAAVGLAILVIYHKNKQNIDIEEVSTLKG